MITIKRKSNVFLILLVVFTFNSCKTNSQNIKETPVNTYYYLNESEFKNTNLLDGIDNEISSYIESILKENNNKFVYFLLRKEDRNLNIYTLKLWFQDNNNFVFESYSLIEMNYTLKERIIKDKTNLKNEVLIEKSKYYEKIDGSCFGCNYGMRIIKINNKYLKYLYQGQYYDGLNESDKNKIIIFKTLSDEINMEFN